MATIDHIHPGHPASTASAGDLAIENGQYVGKHRQPETRRYFSLFRFLYVGRHRGR